ncbi:MAG: STAS domain-containing protein [Anaerolineales bacterium]|nr:STAS domain-containing protein [Anaerolineales bacterium]
MVELPNGITRINLVGRLDVSGAMAIEDKFTFAVATDKAPVLVDLSAVDFIASIGMRLLLMNAKTLNSRGIKLVLFAPQPLVKDALVTAGIDLLIPVYDDFDTACTYLLQPSATSK